MIRLKRRKDGRGRVKIPKKVEYIVNKLMEEGFEAYIVGGCVRDSLLEKEPKDWDITTSAKPEQVKALFQRTIDTGIQHGTVTIMLEKEGFEVTTYRIDGEYKDNRHPKSIKFTANLEDDLKRRDFTINAMAYNKKEGLIDKFEGRQDLEKGIIRCVGNAEERFEEDALRMLRAIRFAGELGFSIEKQTEQAIQQKAANLKKISAERIQIELNKLLSSKQPKRLFTAYKIGITKVILPEFDRMMETSQNHPYHIYNVGEHSVKSIEEMLNMLKKKDYDEKTCSILVFTMLLHDVGKPDTKTIGKDGFDHFYAHPIKSAKIAKKILQRLKFDNDTIDNVVRLIQWHDYNFTLTFSAIRKAIYKIGEDIIEWLFLVQKADAMAQNPSKTMERIIFIEKVEEIYKEVKKAKDCINLKMLNINGNDLIHEGFMPGKRMGNILAYLLELVLENPQWNEKDILLQKAYDYEKIILQDKRNSES